MKHAVITGASTGIGRSTVSTLIHNGFHVFAGVRKQSDCVSLTTDFGDRVTPLIIDVTDSATIDQAADKVKAILGDKTLDALICNAGIAKAGPLLSQPLSAYDDVWNVNVRGLIATVQHFAPLLGVDTSRKGPPGRIVMISSVSGKQARPFLSAYSASKFAVEAVSHALRGELMPFGIKVIIIGPGPIQTPIWDKGMTQLDWQSIEGTVYEAPAKRFATLAMKLGQRGLAPEAVAHLILKVLTKRNPNVRYAILRNALMNYYLPMILPYKLVDKISAKVLGIPVKEG